jgi:hypothetical protein
MQLFGLTFRLTRMDAGVYPFDPQVFRHTVQRLQMVSYCIIALLTLTVMLSTRL